MPEQHDIHPDQISAFCDCRVERMLNYYAVIVDDIDGRPCEVMRLILGTPPTEADLTELGRAVTIATA